MQEIKICGRLKNPGDGYKLDNVVGWSMRDMGETGR